jgi:adenylosuccinate synthase
MEYKIVLGHAFGDEGKGVTTQWLCQRAINEGKKPLVIRFSGGPQAAHTISHGGVEHICSSFGSGVLLNVPTIYTSNFFLDPICFTNEMEVLESKGIKPQYSLSHIGPILITPYDVMVGISDEKVLKDGTCGKGIYPTFKRVEKTYPSIVNSIHIGCSEKQMRSYAERYLQVVKRFYGITKKDVNKKLEQRFIDSLLTIQKNNIKLSKHDFDVIIYEGTQGLLLDMEHGFYPNVTPSRVGLNGIIKQQLPLRGAEVYLVTRTYTTRHGNGYTPLYEHDLDLSQKHETNVNNQFQGEFKTGAIETSLLNTAFNRHCIDNLVKFHELSLNLVITHMDVIKNKFIFEENKASCKLVGWVDEGLSPKKVADQITECLIYKPDHVFYNDSVESNIKQLW